MPVAVTHSKEEERAIPVVNTSILDWDLEEQLQASGKQGKITRNKIIQTDGHRDMK